MGLIMTGALILLPALLIYGIVAMIKYFTNYRNREEIKTNPLIIAAPDADQGMTGFQILSFLAHLAFLLNIFIGIAGIAAYPPMFFLAAFGVPFAAFIMLLTNIDIIWNKRIVKGELLGLESGSKFLKVQRKVAVITWFTGQLLGWATVFLFLIPLAQIGSQY